MIKIEKYNPTLSHWLVVGIFKDKEEAKWALKVLEKAASVYELHPRFRIAESEEG